MIKTITTTTALTLAIAIAVPAQAQLIHGGLGGGLGGGIGMPMGGIIGGAGIGGTLDDTNGTLRSATRVQERSMERVRAPKTPKLVSTPVPIAANPATALTTTVNGTVNGTVRVPSPGALPAATFVPGVRGRIATTVVPLHRVIDRDVTHIVVVPAIPDLVARRTAFIESGIAPITYEQEPAYIATQYQALQNDLRGTGVDVVRRGQQIVLEMPSDVTFAFNKSNIQPRFYPVLDAVAQTLTKYRATYVDVDGHTDAIGSLAYNQTLSERRAATVADYLADHAVTPARLHVEGFGKTEPIASNATIMGRAANRRVEIVLTPYVG